MRERNTWYFQVRHILVMVAILGQVFCVTLHTLLYGLATTNLLPENVLRLRLEDGELTSTSPVTRGGESTAGLYEIGSEAQHVQPKHVYQKIVACSDVRGTLHGVNHVCRLSIILNGFTNRLDHQSVVSEQKGVFKITEF